MAVPQIDIAIIGAGAAGLAAGIFAGEAAAGRNLRIAIYDGARTLGAKILVSGGGRCNVTNKVVTAADFNGGPQPIIRNVLRAFDNQKTLDWMEQLGVALKLEPTGKYFPVSDRARTVLDALLHRTRELGVLIQYPWRLDDLQPETDGGFLLKFREHGEVRAHRVILAMGGLSLPKSGSDGAGLELAKRLGHAMIPTTPALVPLLLHRDSVIDPGELSGLTLDATLTHRDGKGRETYRTTASFLFTHFGASGPTVLDVSRHWLRARIDGDSNSTITFGHPLFQRLDDADQWLLNRAKANPKQHAANAVSEIFPERLARMLAPDGVPLAQLSKNDRKGLAEHLSVLPLPVVGDRGYTFAETTAGGVDLREVDYRTMQSRRTPGLHLCGEMLDVDGRIGGFNFQWAWASGYLAGRGAVAAL